MGYAGWHAVTDPSGMLLAVSFEPTEGTLVCRFSGGQIVIHLAVTERIYSILIRSPYAGTYYRKYVQSHFQIAEVVPADHQPSDAAKGAIRAKNKLLSDQRLANIKTVHPAQTNLFGEAVLSRTMRKELALNDSWNGGNDE